MIEMNDLLKLAIEGHGGVRRWEQISPFRAAASITGAIWALKGHPGGPLDRVVLEGETRDQRLTITPFSGPGRCTTWEPNRQTVEKTDGDLLLRRHRAAAAARLQRGPPGQRPAVHYPSEYREFDGIMVPTAAGSTSATPTAHPIRDPVSVAIDISGVSFS
jgi:hypothetical protein